MQQREIGRNRDLGRRRRQPKADHPPAEVGFMREAARGFIDYHHEARPLGAQPPNPSFPLRLRHAAKLRRKEPLHQSAPATSRNSM